MITVRWPRAEAKFPQVEFRRIFRQIRRPAADDAAMVTAYTDGVVTLRSNRRLDGYHEAADMSGMQGVKMGDFVVHGLDILRGSVGISDADGAMSSVCVICAPIADIEPRYFAWQIRAQAASGLPRALARGVREGGADFRRWDTLAELPVLCPPVAVQRAIADYLDRKTVNIDALIAMKQRTIDLLEEKSRRAIGEMTRRGLNPSAKQVDSGLPWIGRIPAHWRILPNRSTMRIVRRPVTPGREPTLLSLTKRGVIVRDVSENFGKFPASFDTYQIVHDKELVFCLFDIPETPRTVGLSEQTGMVTGAYVVAAAQSGASPEFIRYLYEGIDDEKSLSLFYTGLRKVIRPGSFMSIRMPLPPEMEQHTIVSELNRLQGYTREAVRLLSTQIELLREHRQALIANAVTGELEVPRMAA